MYTSLSLLILLIGRILISFLCTIIKIILFTICLLGLMHLLWDLYGNMLSLMMWKWGNSFSYISLPLIIKCYISIQIIIILNLCICLCKYDLLIHVHIFNIKFYHFFILHILKDCSNVL